MLTHFRYTVAPSYVEIMLSVKNDTEINGLRRAYLRDGASFVRFLIRLLELADSRITGSVPSMA